MLYNISYSPFLSLQRCIARCILVWEDGEGRGRSAATGVLMQHNLDFSTLEAAETRVREPRTPQPPTLRDLNLSCWSHFP